MVSSLCKVSNIEAHVAILYTFDIKLTKIIDILEYDRINHKKQF